jgi:hypothetical protein
VLQSLSSEFDRYLARAYHMNTLLLLLADEVFEIKVAATTIVGRLAHCNPAAVLPPIRQQLVHLISEMKNCPDHHTIEEAAIMLCTFLKLSKFHVLVRPFMITLLSTLPLQSDFRSTTAALEALGELSIVLQSDFLPYVDNLLPIIITNMLDSSSYRKQEVAIKTLGQVVSSTGLVIRPYLVYPQLLPSALDLLFKNSSSRPYSLRLEVLRTIGLLGALEPIRFAAIQSYLHNAEQASKAPPRVEELKHPGGSSSDRDREADGGGAAVGGAAAASMARGAAPAGAGAGAGAGAVDGAATGTNTDSSISLTTVTTATGTGTIAGAAATVVNNTAVGVQGMLVNSPRGVSSITGKCRTLKQTWFFCCLSSFFYCFFFFSLLLFSLQRFLFIFKFLLLFIEKLFYFFVLFFHQVNCAKMLPCTSSLRPTCWRRTMQMTRPTWACTNSR